MREIDQVMEAVRAGTADLNTDQYVTLVDQTIGHYHKIFIAAAGRSRLVANMFAMRLMQCGKTVHVVGEVTCPSIDDRDLLILISGSGETRSLRLFAEQALDRGAEILVCTAREDSTLAKLADKVILIADRPSGVYTPLGTYFELSCLMFLEGAILYFMQSYGLDESFLKNNHANLE